MKYSDKENKYLKVKQRVEKIRAFYTHLSVYIVVNIVFSVVKIVRGLNRGASFEDSIFNLQFSGTWMLWGVGLAIHAFAVFGLPRLLGNNWEEEKIKKYMEEDKNNNFK